jgi:hypothetical protein
VRMWQAGPHASLGAFYIKPKAHTITHKMCILNYTIHKMYVLDFYMKYMMTFSSSPKETGARASPVPKSRQFYIALQAALTGMEKSATLGQPSRVTDYLIVKVFKAVQ